MVDIQPPLSAPHRECFLRTFSSVLQATGQIDVVIGAEIFAIRFSCRCARLLGGGCSTPAHRARLVSRTCCRAGGCQEHDVAAFIPKRPFLSEERETASWKSLPTGAPGRVGASLGPHLRAPCMKGCAMEVATVSRRMQMHSLSAITKSHMSASP